MIGKDGLFVEGIKKTFGKYSKDYFLGLEKNHYNIITFNKFI